MIGGVDKYMPLCRECHAREINLHADNTFVGDPSKIYVDIENSLNNKTATNEGVSSSAGGNRSS